jgi:hypothetical protein
LTKEVEQVKITIDGMLDKICPHFHGQALMTLMDEHEDVTTFLKSLKWPVHLPHIAVYYQTNSEFRLYDMFLLAYDIDKKDLRV